MLLVYIYIINCPSWCPSCDGPCREPCCTPDPVLAFSLQDDEIDEPDVLDLDYTNIALVLVTAATAAAHPDLAQPGHQLVELQCKTFPECLGEDVQKACQELAAAAAAGGRGQDSSVFTLGLVLQESQLTKLLKVLRAQVGGHMSQDSCCKAGHVV